MIAYEFKKIVFFKKEKAFASEDGMITHLFENAIRYDDGLSDETIKEFYDDVQDDMEIWKIRVTIETFP